MVNRQEKLISNQHNNFAVEYDKTSGDTAMSLLARNNAWIFSCESWMARNMYIILPVNPNEISFQMPLCVSNESYRGAHVTYLWRDRGFKSLFDSPVVSFNVPSGNIMPSFSESYIAKAQLESDKQTPSADVLNPIPSGDQIRDARSGVYRNVAKIGNSSDNVDNVPDLYRGDMPIGIQNVYAFHALAEERRIRTLPGSTTRTDNRVVAVVSTLIFPRLVLYGFFSEEGIETEESSENPGEVNLKFSLVVTDTYPRLKYNNWSELNDFYVNGQSLESSTLEFARTEA